MQESVLIALGGIGLFLLGMLMLTDGLRALAGDSLRRFLRRSTSNPLKGVFAGALSTAIVQSSSATTVAAVGFVGAGLMTFTQALGIIFGANIGTTITGWLIAIIGFKLQLGTILTPFILVGVLLKIFGSGRWRDFGWVTAGFSLLFVGIAMMQQGMTSLEGVFTPETFPSDSILGRLQLVLIGIGITIITQSSSAGVATAMSALTVGAISFPQAAAMVIGMDIGTTFTAFLATIGGGVATRRTGYAHVIYNVLTGIMAFCLLIPLGWLVSNWAAIGNPIDLQLGLVAFHTFFNLIGVIAVIGLTSQFAKLIMRLVPDVGPRLTARLDGRLLADAPAATDALTATIKDCSIASFDVVGKLLHEGERPVTTAKLQALSNAEEETRLYAERIKTSTEMQSTYLRHTSAIHALDHLIRLNHRCRQRKRIETMHTDRALKALSSMLLEKIKELQTSNDLDLFATEFDTLCQKLREQRYALRKTTIANTSAGKINSETAIARMDAVRWLHRVSYHVWRIFHHRKIAENDHPNPLQHKEPALEKIDE